MKHRVSVFLCACVFLGTAAQAELLNLSSNSRSGVFRSQTSVLDSRAATNYTYSFQYLPPSVHGADGMAIYSGTYKGPYLAMARNAARQHRVPEDLFLRLVQQESGWSAAAKSNKGAVGLAQLMPLTARRLSVDPLDPRQNLEGGARYLRQQYDRFGSWRLALAAYNAGPEAVEKYDGVPPYRETKNYVKSILGS